MLPLWDPDGTDQQSGNEMSILDLYYKRDGSPIEVDCVFCHGDEHRKYPKEMN